MAGIGAAFAALWMLGAQSFASAPAPVELKPVAELGSKWGIVTSLKRTPERNRAVGGAPNSFHLSGRAIDIARRPGVRHSDVEAAFRKAGYFLVESLDEGDHSHFAFGSRAAASKPPAAADRQLAQNASSSNSGCRVEPVPVDSAQSRRRPDRSGGCPSSETPAA